MPVVWSMLGPVRTLPVEPLCLVQSKRSVIDWLQEHIPFSKLQSNGTALTGLVIHLPTVVVNVMSSIAMSP